MTHAALDPIASPTRGLPPHAVEIDAGRVLLVDDDQSTCELIATGLERHGFAVDWHTRPSAALAAIEDSGDYDVVLADIYMDGLNGLDICERVGERAPEVPVVMVTGRASKQRAIDALRVGAYDFLEKPIDIAQLATTLSRGVAKRRKLGGAELLVRDADSVGGPLMRDPRPEDLVTVHELERRYIYQVLELVDGNKSRASRILGLDRRTLYRKLERYESGLPAEP